MANLIQIKRASDFETSENPVAYTLAEGELAFNNNGKKLWIGRRISNTGSQQVENMRVNPTIVGTTNEIDVTASAAASGTSAGDTLTLGLPDAITISGAATVGSVSTSGAVSSGSLTTTSNVTCGNDLSVGGDITVTGDLTVNGTTTTINSTTVAIDDKTFVVADGQSAANCDASGYFISDVASLIYEHTGTKLQARVGASLGAFEAAAITGTTITATTFAGGNVAEWDTAYSDRNKWDGGATGLTAATGRTSLGLGTSAVLNTAAVANGASTVSTGDQIYDFVIGLGYSTTTGTVTSVTAGTGLTGGTITGSGTIAIDSTVLTTSSDIDGGTF